MQQPFSNPIAPPDKELTRRTGQLSNDDFRVLLMTPRGSGAIDEVKPTTKASSVSKPNKPNKEFKKPRRSANSEWLAELRKEEDERIAEWAKNYRDRAKERRDGTNTKVPSVEDALPATSGYRAVAPNTDSARAAEQRKQAIANSKYLGGDMEHTYLVKGLDYALLNKVRSEMFVKEQEKEEIIKLERRKEKEKLEREKREADVNEEVTFKTKLGKNIHNILFESKPPERNDFFLPGRMAYVFELDDEYAESDIPTTLIRSKADCPSNEYQTTLSTNDIVINKLTQILSYLRHGTKDSKKSKKKDKGSVDTGIPTVQPAKPKVVEDSIFPDAGEYDFEAAVATSRSNVTTKSKQYFDSISSDDVIETETKKDIQKAAKEFVKAVGKKYSGAKVIGNDNSSEGPLPAGWSAGEIDNTIRHKATSDGQSSVSKKPKVDSVNVGFGGFDEDHYAECYPGGMEEMDATVNSDDEADFTKMDMGNRKGPVKRWDFDTDEDYGNYQSSREALPKAAFQYGVKMNDGRKTRRQGAKNDKAKLNREWQQISQILQKRKSKELNDATKRMKSD